MAPRQQEPVWVIGWREWVSLPALGIPGAGMAGKLPFLPVRMGGWWRANNELDVVAIGQEAALLVECKWSMRPIGVDILGDLERKASLLGPELGDRRRYLGLCARSGFTPQVGEQAERRDDLLLFDLPEITAG